MKAVIFGISGQDGYYLNELLIKHKISVTGVSRSKGKWLKGDVGNNDFVKNLVKKLKPDFVFHLAAVSTTDHSALFENHKAICIGSLNILESVRKHSPNTKVFLSGSAMQFKNDGKPIDESSEFEASSAYSVARIQSVYSARYYREKYGIKVYVGYFFNHDSFLRSKDHINQKIVTAAKNISSFANKRFEIGNLEVRKEFNYAGDIVRAIWILVNQDNYFEVVIGSGEAHSIKDWVNYCFNKVGKNWRDYIVVNRNFVPDYKILVSNPKIIKSLGWKPKVDIYKLADLMMESKL